jgi:hypothetical protein
MPLTIEWASRSSILQRRLKKPVRGLSFWLTPAASPVSLGEVAPKDVANWDNASVTPIPVDFDRPAGSVSATLPAGTAFVRLDFDLKATAGGKSATVLAFRQLFVRAAPPAGSGGGGLTVLLPSRFSFAAEIFTASPTRPFRQPVIPTRRQFLGVHPLLQVTPNRVSINAEFVDATDLWWELHGAADKWRWYLDPDVGGRQQHLRVLAWTGGGRPMIWFAAVPDATAFASSLAGSESSGADGAAAADIVFFRPTGGHNSFVHTMDANGFADTEHQVTTMWIVPRYLIGSIDEKTMKKAIAAGRVHIPQFLCEQILPKTTNPNVPPDPMDLVKVLGVGNQPVFRPCGFETALNRSGGAHVLFLPVPEGETDRPYEGAELSGLRASINSALLTLWNGFAVARQASTAPALSGRRLWLGGHSGGNSAMWTCLRENAVAVDRVISFDSSPRSQLVAGFSAIKAAVDLRRKTGGSLDVFVISTPHLTQNPANGFDDALDTGLRATGARITPLPAFSRRSSYWQLPPTDTTNAFLKRLLGKWTDAELAQSAKTPQRYFWLFFHELAVSGGDLVQPAATGSPPPPPFVRTFFEQALGTPDPRPSP